MRSKLRGVSVLLILIQMSLANYTSFKNEETNEVGLKTKDDVVCLSLTFSVNIINYNINSTENPFDLAKTTISGKCSPDAKGEAHLTATTSHDNRKKKLRFYFHTKNVYVKQYEELRWQMRKVIYIESYDNKSAVFESRNASIVMSAPLNQKFVCKDKLNITLENESFKDVVVEFLPVIDVQPYGLKSNLYVCERTRKRTLSESFETKTTIFSGIVLAIISMGAIIGHTLRRHMIPERKEQYENLGQ